MMMPASVFVRCSALAIRNRGMINTEKGTIIVLITRKKTAFFPRKRSLESA